MTFHQGVRPPLVSERRITLPVPAPMIPGYDGKAPLSPNHFELSAVKLTFIPAVLTVFYEKIYINLH